MSNESLALDISAMYLITALAVGIPAAVARLDWGLAIAVGIATAIAAIVALYRLAQSCSSITNRPALAAAIASITAGLYTGVTLWL